ncbi:MAG: hypothetical protein ABSE16_16695 [Verrucomicrobiota bacterium]|jgi:hypothetical protein
MKMMYRAALLAALGAAGFVSAQAQINPNDLALGFTVPQGTGNSDYVVDLGGIPTGGNIVANENTVLSVSGFNGTTFSSVVGSYFAANEASVGIVGGANAGGTGTDVILSVLASQSNPGTTASSSAPTPVSSQSALASAAGTILSGGIGTGQLSQTAANSWFQQVAENSTTVGAANNSFASYLNNNPMTILNGTTGTEVLDLYENMGSGRSGTTGWAYDGNVTLDVAGGNLTATYDETATAVPEPNILVAGLGALALCGIAARRNKLNRKQA